MYERSIDKLLSKPAFVMRLIKHFSWVLVLLIMSVLIGAVGLIIFENRTFEDAVMHSAFLLSGFGIVEMPESLGGKLFISMFGLYCNLFFLAAFSLICAPIIHRILHKIHMDTKDENSASSLFE